MASELIFITGATGFIGSHTVNSALAAGYRVRLSVRRKDQERDIRRWIIGFSGSFEFAHVPDLTTPNAFKGMLDDVDYIFHLASPLPGKGEDVHKDYVDPAVSGTLAILKEAACITRVKFVIVMSSILALITVGGMNNPPVIPKGLSQSIGCIAKLH
jgi:nucleoside-diphosphate-sugar epimerase